MAKSRNFIVAVRNDPELETIAEGFVERLSSLDSRRSFELFSHSRTDKKGSGFKNSSQLIEGLAKGDIDIAFVEGNDLAAELNSAVEVTSVFARGNPFDVFISSDDMILDEQPEGARIAVCNQVQKGQMLYYRPDLGITVERECFSRLSKKLVNGSIDGFVYPAARVEALGKQDIVVEVFTSSICMPVAGQGAIALLSRRGDRQVAGILKEINDASSFEELELERSFIKKLAVDRRIPVGVLSSVEGSDCKIEAMIVAPDGSERISASVEGKLSSKDRLISGLIKELLSSGGEEILKTYKQSAGSGRSA